LIGFYSLILLVFDIPLTKFSKQMLCFYFRFHQEKLVNCYLVMSEKWLMRVCDQQKNTWFKQIKFRMFQKIMFYKLFYKFVKKMSYMF